MNEKKYEYILKVFNIIEKFLKGIYKGINKILYFLDMSIRFIIFCFGICLTYVFFDENARESFKNYITELSKERFADNLINLGLLIIVIFILSINFSLFLKIRSYDYKIDIKTYIKNNGGLIDSINLRDENIIYLTEKQSVLAIENNIVIKDKNTHKVEYILSLNEVKDIKEKNDKMAVIVD